MSALAGSLAERVTCLVRAAPRDDLGGASGVWTDGTTLWAAVRPDGAAVVDETGVRRRWAVTLRAGATMPERVRWGEITLALRWSQADPATPDRIVLHMEETR